MSDNYILLTPPMLKATLDGRKTMMRVVVNKRVRHSIGDRLWVKEPWQALAEFDKVAPSKIPFGADINYLADNLVAWDARRRSRWHMPKWASRITLLVTRVAIRRLQDISETEALSEGVERVDTDTDSERHEPDYDVCPDCGGYGVHAALGDNLGVTEVSCHTCNTHKKRFINYWKAYHKAGSWEENPWVAVYTFKKLKPGEG